jgi:hypothetical protein
LAPAGPGWMIVSYISRRGAKERAVTKSGIRGREGLERRGSGLEKNAVGLVALTKSGSVATVVHGPAGDVSRMSLKNLEPVGLSNGNQTTSTVGDGGAVGPFLVVVGAENGHFSGFVSGGMWGVAVIGIRTG